MPYEIAIDPYIDPVSGVLKNKLGISNELELARSEEHNAVIAAVAITDECRPEKWDAALLCWLHKELFGSHYEWAGQYRTVEISKGTSRFAPAEHIPTQVAALFHALEQELPQWKEGEPSVLSRLAHYYSEFNAIHPFREGNGRTIRLLLTLIALRYGWRLEWEHISAADNIKACVKAFYGDEKPLCHLTCTGLVTQSCKDFLGLRAEWRGRLECLPVGQSDRDVLMSFQGLDDAFDAVSGCGLEVPADS